MMPASRNLLLSKRRVLQFAVTVLLVFGPTTAKAAPTIVRSFNGPDTEWELLENGVPARMVAQSVLPGGAHDSGGAEHLMIAAPVGRSAFLICETNPVAVLDELEVRMWANSNRPGVQLAARVVMPRTIDPKTQIAVKTIIRGNRYDRLEHWQQLNLSDVPRLLAEEVRVMRADAGYTIDPRQAFVDAIVLIVPGQPEGTEVITDDLEVSGIQVEKEVTEVATNTERTKNYKTTRSDVTQAVWQQSVGTSNSADPSLSQSAVRLVGTTMLVDGKPFLPRAIQWQGESLQFLFERGFNTIQLAASPTPAHSAEAQKLGLWFICPPLLPNAIAQSGLGRADDRVLAWYLEDTIGEVDPDYFRFWAELVRTHDVKPGRPIIVAPEADWQNLSKAADIVVAGHPLAGRMSETEYEKWYATVPSLTKPGIPLWASYSTQLGSRVADQCTALGNTKSLPPAVDSDHLEALVRIATSHACRGCLFRSTTSLDEKDAATRLRAMSLELINRRLQLIEPWLAGGKLVGKLTSSDPTCSAVVLYVDRARLLMPLKSPSKGLNSTIIKANSVTPTKVWTIPGVPESSQAYSLSPSLLRPLDTTRVAGGTRVSVESNDEHLVLMTEDPQVIINLRQRIARSAPLAIRLERDLAAGRGARLAEDSRQLGQLGYQTELVTREIASANALVRQCDALLASNRSQEAVLSAQSARRELQRAAETERGLVTEPTEFGSYPLGVGNGPLANHARFLRSLEVMHGGENLLYGGDFEDLGQLTQFGWQHISHPVPGVNAQAELSTIEPKHGRFCVRLSAVAANPAGEPLLVPSAPVWINSPPAHFEQGQIVAITGWVRITEPIEGSVGGLQIVDSIGGAELSLSIRHTTGWQPFQIIRAAPQAIDLRLTFALTGLGTADLDALMVRTLTQPIARRLPPVPATDEVAKGTTDAVEGPLFVSP